jgi:hypothetical protein
VDDLDPAAKTVESRCDAETKIQPLGPYVVHLFLSIFTATSLDTAEIRSIVAVTDKRASARLP